MDSWQATKSAIRIIERVARVVEIGLSSFLICAIVASAANTFLHVFDTSLSPGRFQVLMDETLVYIIGLEVALMLIKRDPYLVTDILVIAIARKMIMQVQSGPDFLFDAIAILLLCLVKCYGFTCALPGGRKGVTRFRWGRRATESQPSPSEGASAASSAASSGE